MENVTEPVETETAAADLSQVLDGQPSSAESPQEATPQPAPAPAPEGPAPQKEEPFWYRKAIEKEKRARQALERELEQARQQQPQAQPQYESPQQYFETMRVMDRLERSEDRFIDKHGEQEFEAVKDWLATRPDIEAWAIQQRHPWGAAFQQYQRERLSAEIGDDPNAWRERERERLRQELQAEMQGNPPMTQRPNIPAPASAVRSTAPRGGGGFAGPKPLGDILGR